MSPSASRHVLPASRIITPHNSSRRARMAAAAFTKVSARCVNGLSRHAGYAAASKPTASRAICAETFLIPTGTLALLMAAANCSRALDTEKFRYGSVKNARPLPTSGCDCESLCLSAASAKRSCSDLVFVAEIFSCGEANSTDTSALSMKPALSQLSLLVFSKSRRTKYAMPGIISPTGTYSRMRKPMSETANFKASAMPCNICNSMAAGGKPNCSAVANVAAILRAL